MQEISVAGFTQQTSVGPALSLHLFMRKASINIVLELKAKIAELEKKVKSLEAVQPVSRCAKVRAAGGAKKV